MNKSKKADFAKVKLKVGRTLPKDQNLTNVSFKAKKIRFEEQMQQCAGKPGEKPKFDLEVLVNGLERGKASQQLSNLHKIKDILTGNDGRGGSLTQVMQTLLKICALMNKRDPIIRATALAVIKEVFVKVANLQLSIYYPILKSNVISAANNIDSGVREDSLKFLELVMQYFPESVCDSSRILNSFLDLISEKSDGNATGRLLVSNPDERITAQEWRLKVLKCFSKFLDVNINRLQKKTPNVTSISEPALHDSDHIVIQRHFSLKLNNMLKFSIQRTNDHVDDSLACNKKDIEAFLLSFLPLLEGTWKEAVPQEEYFNSLYDTYNNESIKVMMVIVQVMSKLADWTKLLCETGFSHNYFLRFNYECAVVIQKEFFPHFPVPCASKRQSDIMTFTLNLAFCELFASLILHTSACQDSYQKAVIDFICSALESKISNALTFSTLIRILKELLLCEKVDIAREVPLQSVFEAYCSSNSSMQPLALQFFADLAVDPCYQASWKNPTFELWLEYLPQELIYMCKANNLQEKYMILLKKIASRGYPSFLKALDKTFDDLTDVLEMPDEKAQDMAAFMIAKLQTFTMGHFYKLTLSFRKPSVSFRALQHILMILRERVKSDAEASRWNEGFLSFLLNVALGVSPAEHNKYINLEDGMYRALVERLSFSFSEYIVIPFRGWQQHKAILDKILGALRYLPNQTKVIACIDSFLVSYLGKFEHIPLHAAMSALLIYSEFLSETKNSHVEYPVQSLMLAVCIYETALMSISPKPEKIAEYSVHSCLRELKVDTMGALECLKKNIYEFEDLDDGRFLMGVIIKIIDSSASSSTFLQHGGTVVDGILKVLVEQLSDKICREPLYKEISQKLSGLCRL